MVNQGIKEWDEKTSCRRSGSRATVNLLPNWPPNSPDLNLIENVWAWVQARVDEKGCKNFAEFKAEVLQQLRGQNALSWSFLSPAAEIFPGDKTGTFRLGLDNLLTDAEGKSRISNDDYAAAMLDETEQPQYLNKRFSVAY